MRVKGSQACGIVESCRERFPPTQFVPKTEFISRDSLAFIRELERRIAKTKNVSSYTLGTSYTSCITGAAVALPKNYAAQAERWFPARRLSSSGRAEALKNWLPPISDSLKSPCLPAASILFSNIHTVLDEKWKDVDTCSCASRNSKLKKQMIPSGVCRVVRPKVRAPGAA